MVDGTLTEDEVKNEVTSIFIGGFETTAISIAYTLFLLGNHPEVQAKVHEEIDAIFVEDVERDVTVEDIKQMKYLECESMRLYPPVPLIARDVDEDMKVGEFTVPKGSVAVAAIYFIQRHPKYYEKSRRVSAGTIFGHQGKKSFLVHSVLRWLSELHWSKVCQLGRQDPANPDHAPLHSDLQA
ncbi:hypothetical protein MRX96_013306 [Rhipicephalus microplus]